jgi:hypothetical protein
MYHMKYLDKWQCTLNNYDPYAVECGVFQGINPSFVWTGRTSRMTSVRSAGNPVETTGYLRHDVSRVMAR